MLFLIDTNVFSDLMEEQPSVTSRLKAVAPPDTICTCAIVRGEVYYGISRLPAGKRRDSLRLRADGLFKSIMCEAIPPTAADRYAALKSEMESKGTSIGENDLWIAATALDLGAIVVMRDRGFQHIAALAVQDWTS